MCDGVSMMDGGVAISASVSLVPPNEEPMPDALTDAEETGQPSDNSNDELPSREQSETELQVCHQRLQMWRMYQRAAADQFVALSQLFGLLGKSDVEPAAARARLAVRLAVCQQLHDASHEQALALSEQVRRHQDELVAQLELCRATFATLCRLVAADGAADAAAPPGRLVACIRGELLTLKERVRCLEAELLGVTSHRDLVLQRLEATAAPHLAELRLKSLTSDYDRRLEMLQTRADHARAQSQELQRQLTEQREAAAAALENSTQPLQRLREELQQLHAAHQQSQRELGQTRQRLTHEVAALRSERDTLSAELGRRRRVERIFADYSSQEREATSKALQVLNEDRSRVHSRLCEAEANLARSQTTLEKSERDLRSQAEADLAEKNDMVEDLRAQLEITERHRSELETESRDTCASLRETLALRTSQMHDLSDQLLRAKRTVVEQEVLNDYLQQRLEDGVGGSPPSVASDLSTARLSPGSVGNTHRREAGPARTQSPEESSRLRRLATDSAQEARRLAGQLAEATRTADMLRTELRVALEALQNQRCEADLRLLSSPDTRLHELARLDQRCKELRALATRWQLRAETSDRASSQSTEALREERHRRAEVEASLTEASTQMREIQHQLEQQDQYSTWAKLNQSLQMKQIESVMLALLKVVPATAASAPGRPAALPSFGGGEVMPPAADPAEPVGILKRRWSTSDDGRSCSAGSLASGDLETADLETREVLGDLEMEEEPHTDVSLATAEAEFVPLSGRPCDSSASREQLSEL